MVATLDRTRTETTAELTAEELCRTYGASVCRFAAIVSPDRDEAEELAQEALLKAVRSLRTYDPARGSVEVWLWRIVANSARDAAGRRQRLRDLVMRLGLFAPRESMSVEDAVLNRLRDAQLHAQLRALSLRDRTLLVLRYGLDLSAGEAGAAVGLSPDSAARAIRRALARLRARLEANRP